MNILMITRYFYPHVGGVELHTQNINKLLSEMKHNVTLITEKHNPNLKSEEMYFGTKILRFSFPKIKYLGLIFIWMEICTLYLKEIKKADVIHIHDVFVWYLPFRIVFPKKPVYVTFHGYESYPIRKVAIIQRKIAELFSNGNICIGEFMKKWYKTKPTIVSYGAVDLDKYKTKNKIKNKYDAIFSGRLDEQTGILMYLEAIKILKSKRINFKLVVLGDGIFKGEVKDITEYLGFVKDPSKYYFESKFAFVSRYLAILEAFASKKLVFAVYDNPIKRDYLEMTPYRDWIVIAKNSKILADKVEYYLHNDKETGKLTEPAYRWVQKQTWERMTDNYLKLWGVKWCSET